MAIFIPPIKDIMNFKIKPEEGELHFINFLDYVLDDSFEVFFNPYMNADRPDIVIVRENYGVLIVEVKNWNLSSYSVKMDDKSKWIVTGKDTFIKSPFKQVERYKNNLYDIHIENLLENKIKNSKVYGVIKCAVYFHNITKIKLESFIKKYYDKKELEYITAISFDELESTLFLTELKKIGMYNRSRIFDDDLYGKIKRLLSPSMHLVENSKILSYSNQQEKIIFEDRIKEQRVSGVFGSGKTTTLAARAVYAYKRALEKNNRAKVLILTFNITLCNYIKDKLNNVQEKYNKNDIIVMNYHLFIRSELNNLGIDTNIPQNTNDIERFLDLEYYSNENIFLGKENLIVPYDAILIDEIQDYKREWMNIIKKYFLKVNGEYILFGDVKQNIYNNEIYGKDVHTNVVGKPTTLKKCFRSEFKIKDFALCFQKEFFSGKYEIDNFTEMGFTLKKRGSVVYKYIEPNSAVPLLFKMIYEEMILRKNTISPNDVAILGCTVKMMREFDFYYRYSSREKTNSMFETNEILYYKLLRKNLKEDKNFYGSISNLFSNPQMTVEERLEKLIYMLCTYDLFIKYGDKWSHILKVNCELSGVCVDEFIIFRTITHKNIFDELYEIVGSSEDENVRRNKKIHFWYNSGTIKMSTIHSFKGWESKLLFLILEKNNDKQISFSELIYTGVTRCKSDLFIINVGNENYHLKMKSITSKQQYYDD